MRKNNETIEGKQIKIEVCDQGVGIAPQYLDKIFDPYFSTKQQGSGLGLASCYSIVHKYQGTIEVESELSLGTKFTLTFPAFKGTKAPIATGVIEGAVPAVKDTSHTRQARLRLVEQVVFRRVYA